MYHHEEVEDDYWPEPWLFGLVITVAFVGAVVLAMFVPRIY